MCYARIKLIPRLADYITRLIKYNDAGKRIVTWTIDYDIAKDPSMWTMAVFPYQDHSAWCKDQVLPKERIYDNSLIGVALQNERKKYTRNHRFDHFGSLYRNEHTILALDSEHNEMKTFHTRMGLIRHGCTITGQILKLDNEKRSSYYHVAKEKEGGLVTFHNIHLFPKLKTIVLTVEYTIPFPVTFIHPPLSDTIIPMFIPPNLK